jgi:4-hydroxythreonine-4-phosphate dehydrogenase
MKVYVTQGHEKGIGLEVFFKACLMLGQRNVDQLGLLAFPETVKATLEPLRLPFSLTENGVDLAGVHIPTAWLAETGFSESFSALELGMKLSESGGVLYTLPTSKDQFPGAPGHTEYFRTVYRRPDLGMFFSAPKLNVLLLSDHLPVSALSSTMTEAVVYNRLATALGALQQWDWPVRRVLVSGLNPHAGEAGLIGDEDQRILGALRRLKDEVKIELLGPLPGDTMLLEKRTDDDLLVYLFHDQGLAGFKGLQGFIGSNITLGLPYPRLSPDHGTSFGLFGRNQADYRGCEYSLRQAITLKKKVSHGKDPGHKGKSS